ADPIPTWTFAWTRPRRSAGHRLHRIAGAHPGWTHCQAADRRGLLDREGISRPGGGRALRRRHEASAVRPDARWREAQARTGVMAERTPAAIRAASGPQTPDPPH